KIPQRSTTSISVVAQICYAHLVASQIGQFIKFKDISETTSVLGGINGSPAPQPPKLRESVCNSMFLFDLIKLF
ncbi:hypothetical protein RYX36_006839, partial [Vicia faba]